jgi:hypothetical protein
MSLRKATILSLITFVALIIFPISIFAATDPTLEVCQNLNPIPAGCAKTQETVSGKDGVILKAADIIAVLTGIAAVIMIILGGLRYIFSSGDSNKVNTAKNQIIFAVIGIVVVLVSRSIVVFIINRVK